MPERSLESSNYRYGFNGKEKDPETAGDGNQYDYGFRIYNPRIGRFLSVDPLTKKYPELTPYQFASNTPIQAADIDGLEADLSKAKSEKIEYDNNPFKWYGTFWYNTIVSGWNKVVGSAETSVNAFSKKGREKLKRDATISIFKAFLWIGGKSNQEKSQDIKEVITNPHTYEDVAANLLLAKAGDVLLETPNSPSPKSQKISSLPKMKLASMMSAAEEDGLAVVRDVNGNIAGKGWLSTGGELNLTIKTTGTALKGQGSDVFGKIYNFINKNFEEINTIRGKWQVGEYSSNLGQFNDYIKQGFSESEAAFKTFTGGNAKRLGFNKANVLESSVKNSAGEYTSVDVIFSK